MQFELDKITIIAILAAMLLPALNKARNRARNSKCINQIKQITLFGSMYNNDHDDRITPAYAAAGPYYILLAKYDRGFFSRSNYSGICTPECPSYRIDNSSEATWTSWAGLPGTSPASYGQVSGYGVNSQFGLNWTGDASKDVFVKVVKYRKPSETFYSADTMWCYFQSGGGSGDYPWTTYLIARHDTKVHVGYLDGHAAPWIFKTRPNNNFGE